METIQQITFKDITLHVYGDYTPPEERTNDYPGASSDFQIEKITLDDSNTDIWNLFSWNDLQEIGELVIEEMEK